MDVHGDKSYIFDLLFSIRRYIEFNNSLYFCLLNVFNSLRGTNMKKNDSNMYTMIIKQTYKNYQKEYNLNLPDISAVKYDTTNEFWGKFNTQDLYNQNYILHICDDLMSENKKFIKQILYHEFTHLSDSLQFLDKQYKEFECIMQSYSEYHAAQVEMIERLNEIEQPITLSSEIYHIGILTIESFMNQTFKHLLRDTDDMNNISNTNEFSYDVDNIYHFCGYVRALQEYNVQYTYDLLKITPRYALQCKNIFECLLKDKIIIEDVLKTYRVLENVVLNSVLINNIR